jgi:cytoskeletal protein CcmA (bactofilin family)
MADPNGTPGEKQTYVEEGTQFKGSLTSSCPIVVRGKVEGDLAAPSLTVSPSGSVRGQVRVGEMRSQGELAGEFDADIVQLSGTVRDNTVIRAKSLEVKLQPAEGKMQVIFGECALEVGDMPSKEKEPGTKSGKKKKEDEPGSENPGGA